MLNGGDNHGIQNYVENLYPREITISCPNPIKTPAGWEYPDVAVVSLVVPKSAVKVMHEMKQADMKHILASGNEARSRL
jgi:hypothetical protein